MLALFTQHWGGWNAAAFRAHFKPAQTRMIMVGQKRAGFIAWRLDADEFYLENIQLSPRLQGRGIGTAILQQLVRRYRKKSIGLTTFSNNPALRLYKRLGFKVIRRKAGTLRLRYARPFTSKE